MFSVWKLVAGYAVGMSHLVCAAAVIATDHPSKAARVRVHFIGVSCGSEYEPIVARRRSGIAQRCSAFVPYLLVHRREAFSRSTRSKIDTDCARIGGEGKRVTAIMRACAGRLPAQAAAA